MLCPRCARENRPGATFCDACGAMLSEAGAGLPASASAPRSNAAARVFVGRQQDLAVLRTSLDQALASHGSIVALVGEPGIGKTRTAQVLASEAAARAVRVLWGRCHEQPGSPPYWPWVQVLREYVAVTDSASLRTTFGPAASELAEIVPQLTERLPFIPVTPAPADAAQARFRLFEAVLASWKRVAAAEPLLLVFDNVHWADSASLRLLEFLAPEIAASRLLVVVTYRDIELSRRHPLSGTLAELAKQPNFVRIRLRGLTEDETAQFVTESTGQAPPADLLQSLHSHSEGNPLFVGEMTRYFLEEGLFDPQAGSVVSGPATRRAYAIPDGIKEAIGARLNRLSDACNDVLAHAAVIGRVFRFDLLARVAGVDERKLAGLLEPALAASVIEEMAELGRYQFGHALIRETLYDELPATRRAQLHLHTAEVIEATSRRGAMRDLAALAYHYCAALPGGDRAKAVAYARAAAEHAGLLFAYEEAARYYRMAIEALEAASGFDQRDRLRLLIGEGEALTKAGAWREAAGILGQAAQSAKALGVAHELAHAASAFEEATWRPGLPGDAAARLLRDALAALGEEESIVRVEVLSSLTRALIFSGETEEALHVHTAAIAMARGLGDAATLAGALRAGLGARWLPDRLAERIRFANEAVELARHAGDRERVLEAVSWQLFDLMELGQVQKLKALLADYTREADELRQPFYQYIGLSSRSMLALFEGRFEEAEQWADRALAFGARMPSLDAAGIHGMQMFSIRREQGRLKELAAVVAHFVRTTPEAATWRPGLAVIYSELGMREQARTEFEAVAADDFAGVPRDGLWASCMTYLADVCTFLGDAERAARLYAFLAPFDGRNIVAGPDIACSGAVARHLGMLAATMQRWPDAMRHFEDALDMNERQGAQPWLAHTRQSFATMLLARGLSEDRARALELLDAALDTARAIGMHALAERAATLRESAGTQPPRERYPAGLSRREVEVLQLIAGGKGNREIAERLFVSPNTVANHVRSILTKTNAANRTEAAAFALRNALVKE
jgi:DNA-binding CsgD family transcriptional regulator